MEEKTALSTRSSARRGESTYEFFIGLLVVFSLLIAAMLFLAPEAFSFRDILEAVDNLLCFVFLVDFIRCLMRASNKGQFLKWGWLDVLGNIPSLPALRILRLGRLARSVRYLRKRTWREFKDEFIANHPRSTFLTTAFLGILVLTIGSMVILAAERRSPAANILTARDAFWWAIVTIATVGYGDYYPTTNTGRVVAIVLMFVGVGAFGVLSSFLASRFIAIDESDASEDIAAIKAELAALRELLEARQQKGDDESRESEQ